MDKYTITAPDSASAGPGPCAGRQFLPGRNRRPARRDLVTVQKHSSGKAGVGAAIAATCRVLFLGELPCMIVLLSLAISAGISAGALLVIRRTVARENAAVVHELDRL